MYILRKELYFTHWSLLPIEIVIKILSQLDNIDIENIVSSCNK
nr:CPPV327 hypothetical protein [Cooks petrelpox virus]